MGSLLSMNLLKDNRSAILRASVGNRLKLWLRSDDESTITQSGGAVSQLDDLSGNGNHATQGTGANQPITGTTTQNGRNVLVFDGTNDGFGIPNLGLDGLTDVSVFAVFNIDSTSSGSDNPVSFGSGSEGQLLTSGVGGTNVTAFSLGFFASGTILATGMEDSMNILGVVTSAAASRSYKNGTLVVEDLTPPGAWTTGAGDYGIMASNTPNRWTKGKFAEIAIFHGALDDLERSDIESEMKYRWGTP